jgi:DNA-binding CsgD family transcriptional regulator
MSTQPTGRPRGRPPYPLLTPAEERVLDHIRAGKTNAEIAVRLGVSPDAVKYHVSNMLGKLGLDSREQLAGWRAPSRLRRTWLAVPIFGRFALGGAAVVVAGGLAAGSLLVEQAPGFYDGVITRTYDGRPMHARVEPPVLSGDGRYVVFASPTDEFVAADTDGESDVFRFDRVTRQTELVTDFPPDPRTLGYSNPSVSQDGRFIAMVTSRLAAGDTPAPEVIVRDMDSGATETLPGSPALGPSITADGRLVAYAVLRWPPNAVVVDGFAVAPAASGARLTVYDRETGAEVWGLEIPSESLLWGAVLDWPRISPNGRWVSFRAVRLPGVDEDACPVLRSTGVNGAGEGDRIFIHDLHNGVTHCVPLREAPGTVARLNSFSDAVTDESVVFGYTILESAQSPSGGQRVVETRLARYNPASAELAELGAPNDITFDTSYSAGGMALAYVERSHPPAGPRIVLMDPFGHDTRFTAEFPYRFQPAGPGAKPEVTYKAPALSAAGRHIAYVVRGVDRDSGSQAEEIYVTSR